MHLKNVQSMDLSLAKTCFWLFDKLQRALKIKNIFPMLRCYYSRRNFFLPKRVPCPSTDPEHKNILCAVNMFENVI